MQKTTKCTRIGNKRKLSNISPDGIIFIIFSTIHTTIMFVEDTELFEYLNPVQYNAQRRQNNFERTIISGRRWKMFVFLLQEFHSVTLQMLFFDPVLYSCSVLCSFTVSSDSVKMTRHGGNACKYFLALIGFVLDKFFVEVDDYGVSVGKILIYL